MPVYILAIFADNDTYSLMLSPETASYSLKPIRLKPARLKFPTADYGLTSLWRLTAAASGSTLVQLLAVLHQLDNKGPL